MTERHVLSKQNRGYKSLIDLVADKGELTLVLGAGASMDAGLPSWRGLVETFLQSGFQIAKQQSSLSSPPEALTQQVLDRQDVMSAASVGRLLFGKHRDDALKLALYAGRTSAPSPGRIGMAIAELALAFGAKLRILTTNYDDTVERAIRSAGGSVNIQVATAKGVVPVGEADPEAVCVVHLHGFAPYDGEGRGPLILDEKDYAFSPTRPPGQILPDLLLENGPILFVGLSMMDPNLVAACHIGLAGAQEKSVPWFGLFVGEVDNSELQKLIRGRLTEMGIHTISLLSYGQISQVLYEVLHRIAKGPEYWSDKPRLRYGKRFEAWREALIRRYPSAQGGDDFASEQDRLHKALSHEIELLHTDILTDANAEEHLALHLWVRRPREESLGDLELWGSSAHVHREAWSLETQRVVITKDSSFPAVDSVMFASVQRRNRTPGSSRWQATVAVPIELTDDPIYAHLIVGSITLSSTLAMGASAIGQHFDQVVRRLHGFGVAWLSPTGSP